MGAAGDSVRYCFTINRRDQVSQVSFSGEAAAIKPASVFEVILGTDLTEEERLALYDMLHSLQICYVHPISETTPPASDPVLREEEDDRPPILPLRLIYLIGATLCIAAGVSTLKADFDKKLTIGALAMGTSVMAYYTASSISNTTQASEVISSTAKFTDAVSELITSVTKLVGGGSGSNVGGATGSESGNGGGSGSNVGGATGSESGNGSG